MNIYVKFKMAVRLKSQKRKKGDNPYFVIVPLCRTVHHDWNFKSGIDFLNYCTTVKINFKLAIYKRFKFFVFLFMDI